MKTETEAMDYTLLRRRVYRCRELFPFAGFSAVGRSWNGRALFALRLGEPTDAVLMLGGFDGRDDLTPRLLLNFFEKLCRRYAEDAALADIRIRSLLADRGVTILPCVNPDGLAQKQTGNAHGVNLAENFKPHWAERRRLTQDDENLFAGSVPESEPETRALLGACRRGDFRHMLVLGRGDNTVSAYAPDSPHQTAQLMQKVFCAVGGLTAQPPCFSPGRFCGAAEQFEAEFGRPAFCWGLNEADGAAAAREEALILSCLM